MVNDCGWEKISAPTLPPAACGRRTLNAAALVTKFRVHLEGNFQQAGPLGYGVREIQKSAAHAWMTTTEEYLNQYRDRLSDIHMPLPPRKT